MEVEHLLSEGRGILDKNDSRKREGQSDLLLDYSETITLLSRANEDSLNAALKSMKLIYRISSSRRP
jgi:hypothetical protein